MKTILSKLSDEQAQKELPRFTLFAAAFTTISLFALWFLSIAGLLLGYRALLLTWHKGNAKNPQLFTYRVANGAVVLVSVVIVVSAYRAL